MCASSPTCNGFSLACMPCSLRNPQFHLWCNTYWPLHGQNYSRVLLIHLLFQALMELEPMSQLEHLPVTSFSVWWPLSGCVQIYFYGIQWRHFTEPVHPLHYVSNASFSSHHLIRMHATVHMCNVLLTNSSTEHLSKTENKRHYFYLMGNGV